MAPPKKKAGSFSRPLPYDLAPNNTSPPASTSGKGSSPTKKSGASAIKSNNTKASPDKVAKTPDKSKEPFRFRWMKKLRPSNNRTSEQDKNGANTHQESQGTTKVKATANGKANKKKRGSPIPKKFERLLDLPALTTKPAPFKPRTTKEYIFGPNRKNTNDEDAEMMDTGDDEDDQCVSDEYKYYKDEKEGRGFGKAPRITAPQGWTPPADEHGLVGPDHPNVKKSLNNMEKARKKTRGPRDRNGRVYGRELVQWHRVRMMEKLLLIIQYECHRANLMIPWDKIVHRLRPGSSGPAATQMLNKLRDVLITEGHMIPPPLGKSHIPQDPTIRGFIRDLDADIPTTTRVVRWDEEIEHRKDSLIVPGRVVGSGNYPRDASGRRSTTGINKQRPRIILPEDYIKGAEMAKLGAQKDSQRKRRGKAKSAKRDREKHGEFADPTNLPSDDEWDPRAGKKAKISRHQRKSVVKIEPQSNGKASVVNRAPSMMRFSSDDEATPKDRSYTIKLPISPEKLAKWPSGTPGSQSKRTQIDNTEDYGDELTDAEIDYDEADEKYEEVDESDEGVVEVEKQGFHSPRFSLLKEFGNLPDISYRGPMEHGTLDEYSAAITAGTDPKLNGFKYRNISGYFDLNLVGPSVHMTRSAEGVAHARAKSKTSDHHPTVQASIKNPNGFATAGLDRSVAMNPHSQLMAPSLHLENDMFFDCLMNTSSYEPQPYDLPHEIVRDGTPDYATFAPQVFSSVADHGSSAPQFGGLRRDGNDHTNDYSDMTTPYPRTGHGLNNSLPTSSGGNEYSHAKGDFVTIPGRILENPIEPAGQNTEMMNYVAGWNTCNPSQMAGHMGYEDQGREARYHFVSNDENDHGYADYDDGVSYGGDGYHQ